MSKIYYNSNISDKYVCNVPFKGENEEKSKLPIITKPIEKVENIVNNTVDVFVPETKNEEKKKSHKNMIRVGSTVFVLSAFVLLLNPKFSSGLINKLKKQTTNAGNKAKFDNSLSGKWNKVKATVLQGITNTIQVINNANSSKDEIFKKLCAKTSVTKKVHQGITKWFDSISKHTIFSKYKTASKNMNTLDNIMKSYRNRLSDEKKLAFDSKLSEINTIQKYFNKSEISSRLNKQESLMTTLERDVHERLKAYKNTILHNKKNKKDVFNFWAEEALMPQRNKLETEGNSVINSLTGDGQTIKGTYQEVFDMLLPHLKEEEKNALEEQLKHTVNTIKSANKSECIEYFDKKRDLILGSAPTDVLTAVLSLIASAVAIGRADSKEDRISRTISGALPVVAGLGVSTALTALLYSGGKGMILGATSGVVLSGIGSAINRVLFHKNKINNNIAEQKNQNQEVENA